MFDEFWALYPRKVGRRRAEAAYRAALKRGATHRAIIDGLYRVGPEWVNREANFIPHPTTWLNADGWMDEPLADLEEKRQVISGAVSRDRLGLDDDWAEPRALEAGA